MNKDSLQKPVAIPSDFKAKTSYVFGITSCILLVVIGLATLLVMMANTSRDDPPALDVLISIWPWVLTSVPAVVLGCWSLLGALQKASGQDRRARWGVGMGIAGILLGSLMLAGLHNLRLATQLMHIG